MNATTEIDGKGVSAATLVWQEPAIYIIKNRAIEQFWTIYWPS